MSLSEEKKLLLLKAAENDGVLKMSMAQQLYSSQRSAKSAISSLEFRGYIERYVPGVFKLQKIPDSVKNQFQERNDSDNDYVKEPANA